MFLSGRKQIRGKQGRILCIVGCFSKIPSVGTITYLLQCGASDCDTDLKLGEMRLDGLSAGMLRCRVSEVN